MSIKTVQVGDEVLRKGPWMPEEDEILVEYVRQYGPRDWSSIRSKGLLPRTGKSCRLRSGCKFSPEEEKLVVEMQAKLGNKWAKIASCLPGRTDNDVKNFWSTRQKRLLRALQRPKTPSGKADTACLELHDTNKEPLNEFSAFQVPSPSCSPTLLSPFQSFGPPLFFNGEEEEDAFREQTDEWKPTRQSLQAFTDLPDMEDVLTSKLPEIGPPDYPFPDTDFSSSANGGATQPQQQQHQQTQQQQGGYCCGELSGFLSGSPPQWEKLPLLCLDPDACIKEEGDSISPDSVLSSFPGDVFAPRFAPAKFVSMFSLVE